MPWMIGKVLVDDWFNGPLSGQREHEGLLCLSLHLTSATRLFPVLNSSYVLYLDVLHAIHSSSALW